MDFEVHLTPALQRKVLRRKLFKRWPRLLVGVVFIVIGASLNPFLRPVVFTLPGVFVSIYIIAYFRGCYSIRLWHAAQGDHPVHYHLGDESIRADSRLGSVELKWPFFQEFRDGGDFYALRYLNGGQLTLPSKDVPADALRFIEEKFRSLGLRIC
ncbi:MAG: hypothetical protein QM755_04865 [Luteolibacter sp.]